MEKQRNNYLLDQLVSVLSAATSHPFLFVGSGFSRRYIGLPSWESLLELFCEDINPFQYYYTKAGGCLPKAASLMADDFFEMAWKNEKYLSRMESLEFSKKEDVLKFFIADYISQKYSSRDHEVQHPEEVRKLENINVDSIVTTNWDCYLEDIFPGYSTYVGQDEIVVANPHGIGEIYKIHGCVKTPQSIVLTDDDYQKFREKYAYLAAKLVTFLIEHPVIFIGYSLQDPNILDIIDSLASCLGNKIQDKLRNNLIVVQRNGEGRQEGIGSTQFKVQDKYVSLTTVTTDDFGIVYDAINSIKRKIPARILRFIKEEIYSIVQSNDPKGQILVSDIDEIDNREDVQFIVGVGVQGIHAKGLEASTSSRGYNIIPIEAVIEDILDSKADESKFGNIKELVEGTVAFHLNRSACTPIFKYLRMLGIDSDEKYKASSINLDKAYKRVFSDFYLRNSSYRSNALKYGDVSTIIQHNSSQHAAMLIAHLDPGDIDTEELKAFLSAYKDEWVPADATYKSFFRKLAVIYDRLVFGWID